jgi:phosphoribosylamine-glycine ligase
LRECYGDKIPNLLQRKIDGAAISTAAWWNGRTFIGPFEGTIEHKKFLNDELGPSTGCSFNAAWFYDDDVPKIAEELGWENLGPIFREHEAPPGLYDINAVVNEGKAYFLEWTPRLGCDSETTSHRLINPDVGLGETLIRLVEGRLAEMPVDTSVLALSTRVSVPPYPVEGLDGDCEQSSVGTPVWGIDSLWEDSFCAYALKQGKQGGYEVADPNGMVGIGIAVGDSLWKLQGQVIRFLRDELKAPGKQYRTDADSSIAKDAVRIRQAGFDLPNGLKA